MENEQLTKELVEGISTARNEPTWLLKKRLHAFDQFKNLPKPTFKYGLSIIFNPDIDFSKINFGKLNHVHEVEKQEQVIPFSQALEEKQEIVKKHFLQFDFQDSIDAFNAAFFTDGFLFHVPKNKTIEKPVQFRNRAISCGS